MISPMISTDTSETIKTPNPSRFEEQEEVVTEDPVKVLGKLKELLDAGLITEDEYNKKKAEVIARM